MKNDWNPWIFQEKTVLSEKNHWKDSCFGAMVVWLMALTMKNVKKICKHSKNWIFFLPIKRAHPVINEDVESSCSAFFQTDTFYDMIKNFPVAVLRTLLLGVSVFTASPYLLITSGVLRLFFPEPINEIRDVMELLEGRKWAFQWAYQFSVSPHLPV